MRSPRTVVLLLLAVLLAPPAGRCEQTCLQSCNGPCDLGFKVCAVVPLALPKCVVEQTKCKLKCPKFCSCVGKCQQDCTKPQGACNSTSPAAGNFLCKSQQNLCKKASCPLKCFFAKDDKLELPNLPALPKLGTGLPKLGTGLPKLGRGLPKLGTGLPKLGTGLPLPGLGLPAPVPGLPIPAPGLPKPALGMPLPAPGVPFPAPGSPFPAPGSPFPAPGSPFPAPGSPFPAPGSSFSVPGLPGLASQPLNTKPADDGAKAAKESSAIGTAFLNPAGRTRSPPTEAPVDDYDEDYGREPQAPIAPPKDVSKPANQIPNSASSKSFGPGPNNPASLSNQTPNNPAPPASPNNPAPPASPNNPAPPAKKSPSRYSFFGGR